MIQSCVVETFVSSVLRLRGSLSCLDFTTAESTMAPQWALGKRRWGRELIGAMRCEAHIKGIDEKETLRTTCLPLVKERTTIQK